MSSFCDAGKNAAFGMAEPDKIVEDGVVGPCEVLVIIPSNLPETRSSKTMLNTSLFILCMGGPKRCQLPRINFSSGTLELSS